MAGKYGLDVTTLRDHGRIVNVESGLVKALIFRDLHKLPSENILMELGDFYSGAKPGDYFVYEEGKVSDRPARLCERIVRIGAVQKIRGKKAVIMPEGAPVPEFKRRLLVEEIVYAEGLLSEGDLVIYRAGRMLVETGTGEEGKLIEEASTYSCYALATGREMHAIEKRTH